MSSVRNLWFDTRHLLGGARGQALLAELDALPAPARETLLATGDRLADSSLTLAQVFCRTAPAAWHTFGEERFARWVRVGERFVRHEPTSREGAVAYFSIPPDALARLGWDQVEAWVAIGREVLQVSRRLGAQFLQTSAPLLPGLPAPLTERLRAWARHGSALLRKKGWKGEFLALSYFSAAPLALPVLSPAEMREWAVLGVRVQDSGPWKFYTTLPSGFAELAEKIRLQLLVDCQAAARHSPPAAEAIFGQLPAVLAGLPPPLRAFLLTILAPVIRSDPEALLSLFPLMTPCLNAIESGQRPALREALVALAQDFAPGIPPAIRTLPRAYEEAGEQRLLEWIATGRDIGRARPEAGVTFFALESRTSLRVLRTTTPGSIWTRSRKCCASISRCCPAGRPVSSARNSSPIRRRWKNFPCPETPSRCQPGSTCFRRMKRISDSFAPWPCCRPAGASLAPMTFAWNACGPSSQGRSASSAKLQVRPAAVWALSLPVSRILRWSRPCFCSWKRGA